MQVSKALRVFLMAVCLILAMSCNGCITASLATLGTVLGALGSAASTGVDVYKLGKLDATLMCNASDCHAAAMQSAQDLNLQIKNQSVSDKPDAVYEMAMLDDLKSQVGIRIEYRTRTMCRCRVDVGLFGSEPTARLVMERIRVNLHQPTTQVATP